MKTDTLQTYSAQRNGYPLVDLFAGPGGLGEGFASALDDKHYHRFHSIVSIEKDSFAHQTLLIRHFFRYFSEREVPEDYYDFMAGYISQSELFDRYTNARDHAFQTARKITLAPETHSEIRKIIRERLKKNRLWALVGGPPCQAYSLVGRSRMMGRLDFERDERHTLYLEYLRIIADHRPPVFVMENVKGLLSATIEGQSTISRIVRDLSQPGEAVSDAPSDLVYKLYSLTHEEIAKGEVDPRLFLVRAEEHGIPQARHRMFIVGIRGDLSVKPKLLRKMNAPTVYDTISSLPKIRSGLSRGKDSINAWLREIYKISSMNIRSHLTNISNTDSISYHLDSQNLRTMLSSYETFSTAYKLQQSQHDVLRSLYDERLSVLTAHEARGHMASDLRRYLYAAIFAQETGRSPKLSDFPGELLPNHQNVEQGRAGKMFSDRFRVQLSAQVSTTITSHISKDGHYFIHYDPAQCRSLTVREAARLQTFPDNYYFAGPRTAQYHQVGNAVPPQLAKQIAEIIAEVLDAIRTRKDGRQVN